MARKRNHKRASSARRYTHDPSTVCPHCIGLARHERIASIERLSERGAQLVKAKLPDGHRVTRFWVHPSRLLIESGVGSVSCCRCVAESIDTAIKHEREAREEAKRLG